MRHNIVDKVAHHTKVQRIQKQCYVDAAGINRRLFILPGELPQKCGKSAEVILVSSNEPMKKKKLEVSHTYEGLNIKLLPIR